MRKDEYALTKELRRLEKYGFLLQAKRIGYSKEGENIYDVLFTEDKRILEPGCSASEIMGIINSVETCIGIYKTSQKLNDSNECLADEDSDKISSDIFNYCEYYNLGEIAEELNRISKVRKKITTSELSDVLVKKGLIIIDRTNGIHNKICTEYGRKMGIIATKKVTKKGDLYVWLKYPMEVQKILVEYYLKQ